jgi:hypothetical protein
MAGARIAKVSAVEGPCREPKASQGAFPFAAADTPGRRSGSDIGRRE